MQQSFLSPDQVDLLLTAPTDVDGEPDTSVAGAMVFAGFARRLSATPPTWTAPTTTRRREKLEFVEIADADLEAGSTHRCNVLAPSSSSPESPPSSSCEVTLEMVGERDERLRVRMKL